SSTNPIQNYPSAWIAAAAAAANINKAGGVNGQQIEIVRCDNQSSATGSLACMQMAKDSGAVAEIPAIDSSFGVNADFMAQNNIAGIGLNGQPPDYQSPAGFPLNGGAVVGSLAAPYALKVRGAKKIAAEVVDLASTRAFEPGLQLTTTNAGA